MYSPVIFSLHLIASELCLDMDHLGQHERTILNRYIDDDDDDNNDFFLFNTTHCKI